MINNNLYLKNFFYTRINSFSPLHYHKLQSNDLAQINFTIFSSNLFYKEVNEPLLFSDTDKNSNHLTDSGHRLNR